MGEALRSPACPVIIDDRAPSGAARRRKRLGTFALAAGALLAPSAGGAALGAGWGTSLLTALAMAGAVASITATRPGRQAAPGTNRIPAVGRSTQRKRHEHPQSIRRYRGPGDLPAQVCPRPSR